MGDVNLEIKLQNLEEKVNNIIADEVKIDEMSITKNTLGELQVSDDILTQISNNTTKLDDNENEGFLRLKNIFSGYVYKGNVVAEDGSLRADSAWNTTEFEEITPDVEYILTQKEEFTYAQHNRFAYYDENYDFISFFSPTSFPSSNKKEMLFTAPSTAKYIRYSGRTQYTESSIYIRKNIAIKSNVEITKELSNIGDSWNSSKNYVVGEYAISDNILWKCVLSNTNVRPTINGGYWEKTTVADTLTHKKSTINFTNPFNRWTTNTITKFNGIVILELSFYASGLTANVGVEVGYVPEGFRPKNIQSIISSDGLQTAINTNGKIQILPKSTSLYSSISVVYTV